MRAISPRRRYADAACRQMLMLIFLPPREAPRY